MAIAEGKLFEFLPEDHIRTDFLETIPYEGHPQEIVYETDEFSAVCPFSGLPDVAKVTVRYVPAHKLIELKSLKYYFISFRPVGIYQEKATDRIFKDLFRFLEPRRLIIETRYNVRGGILSTCTMDSRMIFGESEV